MRNGDAGALYALTIAEERRCCGLSEQNLRDAWKILVKPYLDRSEFVRKEPGKLEENAVQGTAAIWFKDAAGKPWRLFSIVNQTENGPRGNVLFLMFLISCSFDDRGNYSDGGIERRLQRIQKHRGELEAIGIERIMLNPSQCLTWTRFEASTIETMKRIESSHSRSDGQEKTQEKS